MSSLSCIRQRADERAVQEFARLLTAELAGHGSRSYGNLTILYRQTVGLTVAGFTVGLTIVRSGKRHDLDLTVQVGDRDAPILVTVGDSTATATAYPPDDPISQIGPRIVGEIRRYHP